jgi:hypothetical protein
MDGSLVDYSQMEIDGWEIQWNNEVGENRSENLNKNKIYLILNLFLKFTTLIAKDYVSTKF